MKWFNKKENEMEKENKDESVAPVPVVLKRKAVITGVSLVLLIVLITAGTLGWYTRMNNISGITLDVADFDFRANYQDETFIVDVNDYMNVHQDKAAPGTGGVIPVLLTNNSETAVEYTIYMDLSGMAPEMLQRVRFYVYRNSGDGTPVGGDNPTKFYLGGIRTRYTQSNDGTYTGSNVKDAISTTPNSGMMDLSTGYTKGTCNSSTIDGAYTTAKTDSLNYYCVTGSLTGPGEGEGYKNSCYEYIYWEWIYELDSTITTGAEACNFYNLSSTRWESWARFNSNSDKNFTSLSQAHDAFDTDIGTGEYDESFASTIDPGSFTKTWTDKNDNDELDEGDLYAYQNALLPKIVAEGVQVSPIEKEDGQTEYTQGVLTSGGGLTVYVNEDKLG